MINISDPEHRKLPERGSPEPAGRLLAESEPCSSGPAAAVAQWSPSRPTKQLEEVTLTRGRILLEACQGQGCRVVVP